MIKIKEGFALHQTANTYLIVSSLPESEKTPKIFAINESGALLWNELIKGTDKTKLLTLMQSEYDADNTELINDIEEFIETLRNMNVLDGE